MAKFSDFKTVDGVAFAVNPDNVSVVRPDPHDPAVTVICLVGLGGELHVEGRFADVVERLSTR